MKPVTISLKMGDQKEEVSNLNSCLLFLLNKGVISTSVVTPPPDVKALKEAINQKMDFFGQSTETLIKLFQQQQQLSLTGQTDQASADKLNTVLKNNGAFNQQVQYKVSGKIYNALQEPIPQQAVMAYDVDLRGARIYKTVEELQKIKDNGGFELLGSGTTNGDGYYEILFDASTFSKEEIALADVVVYAVRDGKITGRSMLSTGKNYENGEELKQWNVFLAASSLRGTAEYGRIMPPVTGLLKLSNLSLFQLADSEEQIKFLADETGQDLVNTRLLVLADTLKPEASKDALSHELLYGLGRQNIPLEWTALAITNHDDLKKAIITSIEQNIISTYTDKDIESLARRKNW